MSDLEKALQIAVRAHAGQTRKNGTPYILHPIRVMLQQSDPSAMIVAILHDVAEDTDTTLADLQNEGFSGSIIEALTLLTHKDATPYQDYVKAIATNPLARAVKLADLRDNMNLTELPALTERDLARTEKYHHALKTLEAIQGST